MAARLTTYLVVAIVAVTFVAGLIVGAQRDDNSGPVDLIIHNGRVHVGDAAGTIADAVAIRGNRILRVGSERDVMRRRLPQTEIVDAKGAAVLHGLTDRQSLVESGLALEGVDLAGASTLADLRERVSAWAAANPEATWIVGRNWPSSDIDAPTHAQLDLEGDARPAFVLSEDGESAWLNSAGLRAARITRRTAAPEGGEIVHDRHGNPTGVLRGTAIEIVKAHLPDATADERAEALRRAVADAHQRGVTSVQDAEASPEDLDLYQDAQRAGELKLRVNPSDEQGGLALKPGTLADLIVRSGDQVQLTVFDGKIVYKRKATN